MSIKKVFTCGVYKYCHVGPTYWHCNFLLFRRQSFESLWRAVFNPATDPCKAQTYDSQSPELTKTSLRRPVSHQKSAVLGFCPRPVLRGTCPFPICGRKAEGHKLISRPGSCTQWKVVYPITRSEKLVMLSYKSMKISPIRWLQNSKQI